MSEEYKAMFKHQDWCNTVRPYAGTSSKTTYCNCGTFNQLRLIDDLLNKIERLEKRELGVIKLAADAHKRADGLLESLKQVRACAFVSSHPNCRDIVTYIDSILEKEKSDDGTEKE